MKKVLVMMAVAMMATASFAWISVTWDAYGFLSANDTDGSLYASQDTHTTMLLWDLVYTTTGSAATPANVDTGNVTYGSDTLLSRRVWEPGSSDVAVTDIVASSEASTTPVTLNLDECYIESGAVYNNPDFDATAGKLYTVIFQYLDSGYVYSAITDPIEVGSWDGSGTRPLPSEVCFDLDGETKIATVAFTPVPEPATMSLLGLGALAMVIRRKLSK